jgi:hypothetical protein
MLPREEGAEQEESPDEPVDHNHQIRKSTIEHDPNTSARRPNATVQRPRDHVSGAARAHNEMARLRRASDWVSRSAATACQAAGTSLDFVPTGC